MSETSAASGLLSLIADQRRAVRAISEGLDPSVVARRPASGKWSALEHVRHLLFAEQAHLGRYVPDGQQWSPLGYTPQTMRVARDLPRSADAPQPSLPAVLAAWDELHIALAGTLVTQDSPAVRAALSRNLKHLRAHVAVVQRLARAT